MTFEPVSIKDLPIDEGDKVVILREMENYPNAHLDKGETGTMVADEGGSAYIELDTYHSGLEEWDNRFELYDHHDPGESVGKVVAKGLLLIGTEDHIVLEKW